MKTARGRVLRDTTHGDGLLSVEGHQYAFRLEGIWKSDMAPRVDMQVDVDFDDNDAILAVRAIDSAAAAREQAARLAAKAGATTKRWATELQARGGPVISRAIPVMRRYTAFIGMPTLIALVAIFFGWFVLAAASIELFMRETATFYQLMGILNNPGNGIEAIGSGRSLGPGVYGFVTFAAWLAPFLPHLDGLRQLWLAYCAPIVWMGLAYVIGRMKISAAIADNSESVGGIGGAEAAERAREIQEQILSEIASAVSVGLGTYLAIAAGLYLAIVGIIRFRSRSARAG